MTTATVLHEAEPEVGNKYLAVNATGVVEYCEIINLGVPSVKFQRFIPKPVSVLQREGWRFFGPLELPADARKEQV